MKVYVDKKPKSCLECPCFSNSLEFGCNLDDGTHGYFFDEIEGGKCPLKILPPKEKSKGSTKNAKI